jgi:hypothetical protein
LQQAREAKLAEFRLHRKKKNFAEAKIPDPFPKPLVRADAAGPGPSLL